MKIYKNIIIIFLTVFTIITASVLIISFKISKERINNPFCQNKYENVNIVLDYEEIKKYEFNYDCSTMYFVIYVDESLTIDEIKSLLLTIGLDLSEYDTFTHFEIHSDSLRKTIYAVINLKTNELSIVG